MAWGFRHRRLFDDVEAFVLFVGYPRSGHTLVGSLLNAHAEVVIAHELDALWFLGAGFSRLQLYALIVDQDERLAARGGGTRADYRVPGQWQGRARRIRVIGDKRGGKTTFRLRKDPALLDRLRDEVEVPLRIVHVVRDPFANIASIRTMAERRGNARTLEDWAERYFLRVDAVHQLEQRVSPDEWLTLRHEDFVADPRAELGRLCRFVGIEADEAFLRACAAKVRTPERRGERGTGWPPALKEEIERRSRRVPFLRPYLADSEREGVA